MMDEQTFRERECVHRGQGASGDFYRGTTYVQWLKHLKAAAAAQFAARVTPFFWADAAQIRVWLCHDCAAELQQHARVGD
jgi:hypothetical protein